MGYRCYHGWLIRVGVGLGVRRSGRLSIIFRISPFIFIFLISYFNLSFLSLLVSFAVKIKERYISTTAYTPLMGPRTINVLGI